MKKNGQGREMIESLPQNEYYESVSERFGIAQVVLYLSLLAFVVLSFLKNTNLITYENLYHFVKDLNASAERVDVWNTDSVSYPTDEVQSFTLYRQGLAVAGNNSVTVFTATGRQTVSQTISYHHPVAVGTGKYLLVYDLGSTQYSLYNAYTQIYAGETDRPISGGTVSNTGMYALTTSSAGSASLVSVYTDQFSLINTYTKNGYVMDVAIDPKGKSVAIVTSSVSAGAFHTELTVGEIGTENISASVAVADSVAFSVCFTETDTVSVLCSGGVYTYRTDGSLQNGYSFDGDTVAASALSEYGVAVSLKAIGTASERSLLVFDKQGNLIYRETGSRQVDAISRYENVVYLQTAQGIVRLDAESGVLDEQLCQTDQRNMLAVSGSELLLCSPQKAVYIKFQS